MAKIAYGKREYVLSAIESGVIPENTIIITSDEESELLFYDNLKNLKVIKEKTHFSDILRAEEWIEQYNNEGSVVGIFNSGQWQPYIVQKDTIREISCVDDVGELFDNNVGDLSELETSEQGTIVGAVNEVDKRIKTVSKYTADLGETSKLQTADKRTVVDAVNYLNTTKADSSKVSGLSGKIGDLSELDIPENSSIVTAINSVIQDMNDGLNKKTDKVHIASYGDTEIDYVLTNNEERRENVVTSLNITLPDTTVSDELFISSVVFTSGETPTALVYPQSITMSGEDCIDGVFVPVKNKRYTVIVSHDGVYYSGVVGGVKI